MVEMERNYITAEYFRTIQVSSSSTGLLVILALGAGLHCSCCTAFEP